MNKIDFAKINKKEDMIMTFNQLKDDYSIAFQQIQELTNNWDELEKWLAREYIKTGYEEYYRLALKDLYDKMKEIKGNI